VIGTEATVASHAYQKALRKLGIDSHEKACPLFVPLVEEGWSEHAVTDQVARIYLDEAFAGDLEDVVERAQDELSVPSSSQLQALLVGTAHLPRRHLDAERRPELAGLPSDRL
jgi:uncharacterized protein YjaZ